MKECYFTNSTLLPFRPLGPTFHDGFEQIFWSFESLPLVACPRTRYASCE